MSLEERLFKSFDDQQKVEHEAREIETLINSFDGTAGPHIICLFIYIFEKFEIMMMNSLMRLKFN